MKSLFLAMLITLACVGAHADPVEKSIVKIETVKTYIKNGQETIEQTASTGFFISTNGVIVTAAHVPRYASKIKVYTHDRPKRHKLASIILADKVENSDFAILKIRGYRSKPLAFCFLNLPGTELMAYAWRYSRIERSIGVFDSINFLAMRWMTTAVTDHGYSGGPMYDHIKQCVAGVAVSRAPGGGTSFTRPETSLPIMDALRKYAPESIGMTK